MDNSYDVIVIGAGNAGLISALKLVKENKKVLILESNNVPGGFATSFIRGRFEFETSLQEIGGYGSSEKIGPIQKLFEKLEISDKINFINLTDAFHVYAKDKKEEYRMPFGIQEFINKMNEYVPGSDKAMKKFFILAEEVQKAIVFLEQDKNVNSKILSEQFPNFMKVAALSTDKVFKALKMPKKAAEILSTYWIYLGSPTSNLSFVHFASTVLSNLYLGAVIPEKRSHEISNILAEEITKNGGDIKYLSTVQEILFEEGKVCGVRLSDGKDFKSKHILFNGSPTFLYGKMIPKEYVPKEALKLTNSRVLGGRGFSIYLGLNQSPEDIGLTDYSYFINHSLDSNIEFESRSSIKNNSCVAIVLNNKNPHCSPAGTTLMTMTSVFFGDTFNNKVTEENYFELKNQIAENIINNFEETTGINIKSYIEEIEIASPVTYARYGGHPEGVIYGYKLTGLDNLLPRTLNKEKENFVPNVRICGGFDAWGNGFSNTYLSGYRAAKLTLLDMKGEEEA
ncbi:MAG: NAD(P)/FAD-dependent oxidoreductase [Bacilli bacterium]|nr:NAD(P)/FAD-dependent oxidoreductase [Bacilli bacterium]